MLALRLPFQARDMASLVKRILQQQAPTLPSMYANIPGLSAMYMSLLSKDPAERPSIDQLLSIPIVAGAIPRTVQGRETPEPRPVAAPGVPDVHTRVVSRQRPSNPMIAIPRVPAVASRRRAIAPAPRR